MPPEDSDSPIHALLTVFSQAKASLLHRQRKDKLPNGSCPSMEHWCLPGVVFPCRTSSVARATNTIPSSSSFSVSELSLSSSSELTITRTGAAGRWRGLVWY